MVLNWKKETRYRIQCEECGATETVCSSFPYYLDGDTPGRYFHRRGWDEENGKTVCKECFGKGDKE